MSKNEFSFIVVYSITTSTSLKDGFESAIREKLDAKPLDKHTFGICNDFLSGEEVKVELCKICNELNMCSNPTWSESDFICLYYPLYPNSERLIKQVPIVEPKSNTSGERK